MYLNKLKILLQYELSKVRNSVIENVATRENVVQKWEQTLQ